MKKFQVKKESIRLILVIWVLLLVGINVFWLYLDKTPPAWDQAAHLRSTVWFNYFLHGKFWGNFWDLTHIFYGYPPLVYFLGALWSFVFGISPDGITLINTMFLGGSIFGVYVLAKEVSKNNFVSLFSAVIFSLFPAVTDISRNMLLDLPLLVWVIWGWYFWLKSDDLKNTKYSYLTLFMLVLASLTKLNGFLYFLPILILLLFKSFKNLSILVKLVIGGFIYVAAVSWWWVGNWGSIYSYLTGLAGQGEVLTDPMNLTELLTWTHYLKLMVLHQIGPIVSVFALFSLFFVPKKNNKNYLLWFLFGAIYVIFTVIKNKDFRFTLPLLPMVTIWISWGFYQLMLKVRWLGIVILVLILGWLGFNFVENSFGWPVKKPLIVATKSFLFEDVDWVGFDDYPVKQLKTEIWPTEELVDDLGEYMRKEISLLSLVNIEEMNNNNLSLYALINYQIKFLGLNIKEVPIDYLSTGDIEVLVNQINYLLVPEVNYEASPFYAVNLESLNKTRNWIWRNIGKFKILKEYELPNQREIYLLKKL